MKVYNKVILMDIKKIVPYFNNPRENDKTVQALIKSIKQVGFNVPIVIDKKNVIIKGHSRYYAAKELKFKKIPCIISEASENDNKADRLYDNAIQELSKWDNDKLIVELRDLNFKIDEIAFNIPTERLDELYSSGEITKEEMEKAMKGFSDVTKPEKHLKFVCPSCGEESYLDREEIDKILK
jgi:hypothetical protein